MQNRNFYIVSVKNTQRDHLYITIWRPDDRGYCWALCNAGKYDEATVRAHLGYYNTGCADIAVPCDVIDAMGIPPVKGHHDNDAGPVVQNNAKNWKTILANVIEPTPHQAKPQYRGAPRYQG